ncbi:hypothetical protein ANTHELSMS3_01244 [Antarctobacter heliothermus]|uniref:LysM domain-containing protein n=1 Tax=Antarctobacter heliothermus TaxID=74033 RepID=A0A222E163_9RHOB|nr:hypothetical protein [Antarctobacter heliothermus]ASP19955.1 hypothetical protein ANTHELSMS3_01244 [Antarctobacter heliothermus]MBT53311.1 hypothetical protein [Mameliella sp.]|tara:strand:+ start:4797 stop:5048 length:252 start_codon:yes stop_codon:yes gene_type:complete
MIRLTLLIVGFAVSTGALFWSVGEPSQAERSDTVQPDDGLPGVALWYYGTTVAHLDILKANEGLLNDPTDLRAGMTPRIPDLN